MSFLDVKRFLIHFYNGSTGFIWNSKLKPYKPVYSYDYKGIFDGKRVAIIGAADSAINTGLGAYIDEFDIIVRINRGPLLVEDSKLQKDIGTRTDVLFTYENLSKYDAGVNDRIFNDLKEQGLKHMIVVMLWQKFPLRFIYTFFKKNFEKLAAGVKYYFFPATDFNELKKRLSGKTATTGFAAIYAIFQSEFKECYITGFTFFRTEYMSGYRDNAKSKETVINTFKNVGLHDIDIEFEAFKMLIKENEGRNIILDPFLTKIVAE